MILFLVLGIISIPAILVYGGHLVDGEDLYSLYSLGSVG